MDDEVIPTETAALREAFEDLLAMEEIHVAVPGETDRKAVALVLPEGRSLHSVRGLIDEFRTKPERIRGTARLGDLNSFLAHVARFRQHDRSVIFAVASPTAPSLTAVYDYSLTDAPRFHEHQAQYECPLAEEWKAWLANNAKPMDQEAFARFIEDRIGDVVVPDTAGDDSGLRDLANLLGGTFATPQKLLELSRGLQVNAGVRVKNAVTLQSGELSVQYDEVHQDGSGAPISVPSLFVIGIPVFRAGAPYRVIARLRYRLETGDLPLVAPARGRTTKAPGAGDAQVLEAEKRWRAGEPVTAIARKVGVSGPTLYNWREKYGWPKKPGGK